MHGRHTWVGWAVCATAHQEMHGALLGPSLRAPVGSSGSLPPASCGLAHSHLLPAPDACSRLPRKRRSSHQLPQWAAGDLLRVILHAGPLVVTIILPGTLISALYINLFRPSCGIQNLYTFSISCLKMRTRR